MNDETNTTTEIDDTEGHGYRVSIQIAKGENDTEGHGLRPGGIKPADDGDDDTEGNCYKYRDAQPQGHPDDAEGHSVKAGHLDAGDDTDGHGSRNPG